MKKSLSIALLILLMINVGGYYLMFPVLRFQTKQQADRWISDEQPLPEEIVRLKIPMAMPYSLQEGIWEPTAGFFEHQGEYFTVIRHKLQRDTLHLLCVRDARAAKVIDKVNNYLEKTQSLPASANSKVLQFLGLLFADYYTEPLSITHYDGYILLIQYDNRKAQFDSPFLTVPSPPPRG